MCGRTLLAAFWKVLLAWVLVFKDLSFFSPRVAAIVAQRYARKIPFAVVMPGTLPRQLEQCAQNHYTHYSSVSHIHSPHHLHVPINAVGTLHSVRHKLCTAHKKSRLVATAARQSHHFISCSTILALFEYIFSFLQLSGTGKNAHVVAYILFLEFFRDAVHVKDGSV